jgi:4'-phosphopantetheinyl transferase EntD
VIEEILPAAAATAEAWDDPPDAVLLPAEEAVISRAVASRRREFTTVRHCARQALARLGLPASPLLPGERGAPQWPAGVVGSMTHCTGYRAAAVAPATALCTLGIDAEPHEPLPAGVLPVISLAPERAGIEALAAGHPGVHWDRLLFCAKESVYKAWFPVTRRWLGFGDAEISLRPDGTFGARILLADPPLAGFSGRWIARDGLLLTAVADPPLSPFVVIK